MRGLAAAPCGAPACSFAMRTIGAFIYGSSSAPMATRFGEEEQGSAGNGGGYPAQQPGEPGADALHVW